MHLVTVCCIVCLPQFVPVAAHAGKGACPEREVQVAVEGRGRAVDIRARAELSAPYALVWQTLTDYDRLGRFIPGMRSSRVIERRGSTAIVEQSGYAQLFLFSYPVEVVVASVEIPPSTIEIHLERGNLKRLDGAYRLDFPGQGSVVLRWEGTLEPDLSLPGWLIGPLMRRSVTEQFRGMVREIERRSTVSAGSASAGSKADPARAQEIDPCR